MKIFPAAAPRWFWAGIVFSASLACAVTGLAQTPLEHFARLNDPDFAARHAAMDALLADADLTPEQLATWHAQAESLEQQHRLLILARHHTLRQLREERFGLEGPGSLGVLHNIYDLPPEFVAEAVPDALDQPIAAKIDIGRNIDPAELKLAGATPDRVCALVTRVLPGFPATGRLQPRDRIVAIEQRPIPGPAPAARFEAMMGQFAAGHELQLTVLRDGQAVEVRVPLANGRGLLNMYRSPTFALTDEFSDPWLALRDRLFADLLPPSAHSATPPPRRGPRAIFDALR